MVEARIRGLRIFEGAKVAFLVFLFWVGSISLAGLPTHEVVHDLNARLKGVRIIRLVPSPEERDSELLAQHLSDTGDLYFKVFSEAYLGFSKAVQDRDPVQFKKQLIEDYDEDVRTLFSTDAPENFFFLEAIDQEKEKVLGFATFERKSPGRYYLSTFAATYFRNPSVRGIGKQLLCSLMRFAQDIHSIELLAIDEPGNPAIPMYEHWGFHRGPVSAMAHMEATYTGMVLEGAALQRFFSRSCDSFLAL